MSPNMKMETKMGGSKKIFGRMLSGENIFQNIFRAEGGEGMIAFASSFPGSIMACEIAPGSAMVVQKKAFLASEAGVELSIAFNKKIGAGFFGGEGFIMQKLSGQGHPSVHADHECGGTSAAVHQPEEELTVTGSDTVNRCDA